MQVELDTNAMAMIGRAPGVYHDPAMQASQNRAEFCYEAQPVLEAIKAGKPYHECFQRKLYVKISTRATKDVAYVPATEQDKMLYHRQYQAFLMKTEAESKGTPLSMLKEFAVILPACYGLGIFTIEDLAQGRDESLMASEGLKIYQMLAMRWLADKSGAVVKPEKQEAEQEANRPKRRGRKPKAAHADNQGNH